ncbi:MAG: ATP-dependent DNA helicase RecQ [Bacteroidia bacterium]
MTSREALIQYWGFTHFRPMQEEIIQSVLDGNDTLALLPTGGGKSICFQVPALCLPGICIVVSPLIALMKDQVSNLNKRGIKAMNVISGMTAREVDVALDNCVFSNYKFLYLSPERLLSDMVQMRIERMKVNLFAVDEAHCISQWGYDFRPSYLKVADIRKYHPQIPVLALTATATSVVRDDIQEKLLFKKKNIFVKSFERKNLSYVVFDEDDKQKRMLDILKKVSGSAIVYCRNRRRTQEVAQYLTMNNIKADFYHAGLKTDMRSTKQEAWINNSLRVMVATNAFGMGIDKPDVRTVIHLDVPDNLEAYYQEAGRGGRDEKTAYAVLLYNRFDIDELKNRVTQNFPELKIIQTIYQALSNFLQIPVEGGEFNTYEFDLNAFCNQYNLNAYTVTAVLKILELDELITLSDAIFIPSRIKIKIQSFDLYNFQVQNPQYDHFIKTLLRSYEGLFDTYTNIHEGEVSKRAGVTIHETMNTLRYLSKADVIEYLPQTDKPQLQFLHARIPAKDLQISRETLELRKQRYIKRMQAIINYVSQNHQCRSMMLLDYFDEKVLHRCGVCDYCRERNKLDLNDVEFENITMQIKEKLNGSSLTIEELIGSLNFKHDEKLLAVINWMIDQEKLKLNSNSKLELIRD